MTKLRKRALALSGALYGVLWIGGIAAYAGGGPPPAVAWTAPLFLTLAAAIVLTASDPKEARSLSIAGVMGLGAEWAGVWTGYPFGGYRYTDVLYPQILGVPVVLFAAWLVLVAYLRERFGRISLGRWTETGVAALWLVGLDLVIDPLAAGPLGYWVWTEPGAFYGVPLTNFAGWLVVAVAIFAVTGTNGPSSPIVRAVGLSIIAFFTALAWILGFPGAGAIGLTLLALDLTLRRRIHPPQA